jgi:hypothetical protein
LALIAESTNETLLSSEAVGSEATSPEELGASVSRKLCDEIALVRIHQAYYSLSAEMIFRVVVLTLLINLCS